MALIVEVEVLGYLPKTQLLRTDLVAEDLEKRISEGIGAVAGVSNVGIMKGAGPYGRSEWMVMLRQDSDWPAVTPIILEAFRKDKSLSAGFTRQSWVAAPTGWTTAAPMTCRRSSWPASTSPYSDSGGPRDSLARRAPHHHRCGLFNWRFFCAAGSRVCISRR